MDAELIQDLPTKQQQLIQTGESLIVRHGIRRITVEEMCQRANVSKVTFYKYFRNKLDLAKQIWDLWIQDGCRKLDEIDAMPIPFPQKLKRMLEYKLEWTERMSPESIEEFLRFHPKLSYEALLGRFLQFVAEAQERGDIRPTMRPEFMMAVRDKLLELANQEQLVALYPSYSDFVREIWDFFFYGILTAAHPEEPTTQTGAP